MILQIFRPAQLSTEKRHLEFLRLIFVDIDINVRFSLLFNNGLRTLKSKFRGWNLFRSTNWNINCRDKCWKKPFCTLSNFSEFLVWWVSNVLYCVDNFPISTFASVKKMASEQFAKLQLTIDKIDQNTSFAKLPKPTSTSTVSTSTISTSTNFQTIINKICTSGIAM